MNNLFSAARIKKDRNFDGTFFFGVKTTGIFCRPSCPSPIAKEENVLYFQSIFEALERGLRPCYRCRPDIEVDYYGGNPDSEFVVGSALKMIYDGYLNYHSVADLANELLLSDRHLRMLFVEHLGVPPVKIAKMHKSLFAKKLLLFSNRSVTDIAYASGFRSLRQFNDVFKELFGTSPTMVRKELKSQGSANGNSTLLLKYKESFDFRQILSFMKMRAMDGVEVITDESYSRTFRTENADGYFTVTDTIDKSALELRIDSDDIRCYMEIYNRVRRMFDLDRDFTAINEKFQKDKVLSKGMVAGHVPRLPVAFNSFEFAVRAVLGQQISVKAATTLASRIAHKANLKTGDEFPEGLDCYFPKATELFSIKIDDLGITKIRQETIKTVTEAILAEKVKLTPNQSFEQFYNDFSALKGIGDWTVNYVAMRGLGMVDSFPASDLGVIKALTEDNVVRTQKEIIKLAEKWRPYRSYAALCLWNSNS
jgi:AraC family transcriptional regulator, regulatory protein of adaptative response / DNA-3-methyladenine glycosylase II